jgi:TRAP-type C4-dicarboxylate transport system permease small subunit
MFIKLLEKFQLIIGIISLSIFFIAIITQVVTRQIGISVIWTVEVANYSFIWAVFMGAAIMVNRKEHFRFDLLSKKLSGKSKTVLNIVTDSILIIFNVAIFYYGIEAVKNFWNYNWVSLPMMKMGYVWISLPIMSITMVIYSLAHLVRDLKELKVREVIE